MSVAGVVFWALVVVATLTSLATAWAPGVIGGGLAGGSAGVSRRKIGMTLAFWLITLAASIAIGSGLYRVFAAVLGG